MYAGDWGHPKAESDAAETAYIADSINTWMNHYLKGTGAAPAAQAEARITLCGPDIGDLYRAPTWEGLSEGSTLIADAGNYSLDTSANDLHVNAMDPVDAFTSDRAACRSTDTTVVTGNAAITQTALLADTTMLGIPEVTLSANPSAANMYIGARLWDVSADDTSQTLVDRGVFRLGDAGAQVANFHLNGNGYTFGVGHKIKIEFTATEAPSFKASTATGTISVSGVQATIPLAAASQKVAP
jgi:predicted acyl esterase